MYHELRSVMLYVYTTYFVIHFQKPPFSFSNTYIKSVILVK